MGTARNNQHSNMTCCFGFVNKRVSKSPIYYELPILKSPTNLPLVIKSLDNWKNISRCMETCLSDVSVWMSSTMFRLNQDNT